MSYAICLDQNTPNFNINNLSPYGFAIYSNFDNYQTPLAQGINYTQLFPFPIGNCPFILYNLPAGATQIIVIDQCDPNLNVAAAIFSPTNITAGEFTIECCYAIIDIPQGPPPIFCETCPLIFDEFPTSTIGLLVAGNLTSTCGPVTDYVIGWYLNGDYSSPQFTSGYGSLFLPYQQLHPLTGNHSVPVLAGNWEGIIHDIAINGVTYSSVSGSAGGQLIPFESCFDTIVVDPLQCDNGPFQGIAKYTHQINFNSQAIGTTSSPVSLTYALNTTTKYFAYFFDAGIIASDEIEIKWNSGNPNATSNPSLYSQPIYLEKLKRGGDIPNPTSFQNPSPPNDPYLPFFSPPTINNTWPKLSPSQVNSFPYGGFQRVLTLNTLETSSNPLTPDFLEITITPNPLNNNTQWSASFQCLDEFDCTDCRFDNWPDSLPKINDISLLKQYPCPSQQLKINYSGCIDNSDFMSPYPSGPNQNPNTSLNGNLIGSVSSLINIEIPSPPMLLGGSGGCNENSFEDPQSNCLSSTGTITLNKIPNQIQLIFNLYSDYLYYKNNLLLKIFQTTQNITLPTICSAGSTNLDYYKYLSLKVPIQLNSAANCGDNTIVNVSYFHINDSLNIVYTNDNNPSALSWSITIPQTPMVNCYPNNLSCNNCYSTINNFINTYNNNLFLPPFTFTTTVGAKKEYPFESRFISTVITTPPLSGSKCFNGNVAFNNIYYYSTHTFPFISSPSSPTGWTNLTSLNGVIPCNLTPYTPYAYHTNSGIFFSAAAYGINTRFPHLTGSFNYSISTNDFEIYSVTNLTATGSYNVTPNVAPPPCPDPLSSLIYSYIGGVATVYSASYFVGGSPILTINP